VTAPEVSARWYRYALGDLTTAQAILADDRLPAREAAYLGQQAAEKAFKSTIALNDGEPPWTHDLLFLRSRAPGPVRTATAGIDLLPLWAAGSAGRYPEDGEAPFDRDNVRRLVRDASTIVVVARRFLEDAGVDPSAMQAE
jgi:HEPN domain-containing protein